MSSLASLASCRRRGGEDALLLLRSTLHDTHTCSSSLLYNLLYPLAHERESVL